MKSHSLFSLMEVFFDRRRLSPELHPEGDVDNGGSSTEGQTWDLNDFVSASLNAGSYSAQFSSAPSDFLFQTDGSGTLTAARIQSLAGLATEDSLNGAVGVDFSSTNGYMRDSNSGLSFISAGDVQNLTQVAVTTGFTGPMRNDSPCAPAWTYSPSIYPGVIWEEVSRPTWRPIKMAGLYLFCWRRCVTT